MRNKLLTATITICLGLTLAAIAAKPSPSAAASSFRVVSATLTASPDVYDGPCPVTIKFSGNITVKGKGLVKYTFVRSDGATAPVYTLDFADGETKSVDTTWTLSPPTFGGWQAIKILSPNELQSGRAAFKGTCLKENSAQNNSQNAADGISSLTAAVAGPAQTAQGQFVACPLKETRTEVTTPLPEPWWNTPQIGKLERVSVQTIGGNQTLVCEYWAYGRTIGIMRAFPEGATDCSAEGNGFQCR